MSKLQKIELYLILLIISPFTVFCQIINPHAVPEEFVSDYYQVAVNGVKVPVFHAGLNVYFASFDFTGKAALVVEKKASSKSNNQPENYWGSNAVIRPLSKGIKANMEAAKVSFVLHKAGQYSVEKPDVSGFKDDVILIFANKPEVKLPNFKRANVIRLAPGVHYRNIDLKTGQTLYLDAGAVLFGAINVWDAKNVAIRGRGIVVYYGPQSEDVDHGWKNLKNWHPLTTNNVQGLMVEGITFVGRSRTWSLQTHTTFDAVFDNIKIIAVNPQNINGDGIDWYGGGRTKVVNSFIRSADDCFALFTRDSSKDMWGTSGTTSDKIEDISIENCVLWSTLANVFRIGFNGQALNTKNISMKKCDVIHMSKGQWLAPWSLFCMASPNKKGNARHWNYLIENVNFEEPLALFGLQNPEVEFKGLIIKNTTMIGEAVPSIVNGKLEASFQNVILNGKLVAKDSDIPLKAESKIQSAQYLP